MEAHIARGQDRTQQVLLWLSVLVGAPFIGLLTAVSPQLGMASVVGLWFVAGFSRSDTFAVCAFCSVTYFEIITAYTGAVLSPIKLTGGALVIVALVALVAEREGRPAPGWRRHPIAMLAMGAYLGVAAASGAWATDLTQVRSLTTRLVTEALVLVSVGIFLQRPKQYRWLAWTILGSAALATLVGMLLGTQLEGRAIGTFSDPNEYAASLIPALALGYVHIEDARSRSQAMVVAALAAICAFGLIGSQSRGGVLAMIAVGGVLFVTSRGRERVRLIGAGLVGICFMVALLFVTAAGQGLVERATSTDSSGRSDLWKVAIKQFERQPLTGVGLGNYPVVSKDYLDSEIYHRELFLGQPRTTHNVPLELLAELGIGGFVAFYTLLISAMIAGIRNIRTGRRSPEASWAVPYARGILASLVGLAVAGIFISGQYQELLWVLMGASFALSGVLARPSRRRRHSEALELAPGTRNHGNVRASAK